MHRPSPALVTSLIALFISLGGGAYAAVSLIPGPDGVIHACYQKKGGNVRFLRAGTKCAKGERAVAFNQTGPQGPQGQQGTQGFPGAAGQQGLQGQPGPFPSTLPRGQTLRGYFYAGGTAASEGALALTSISFIYPLASP